MCSYLYTLESPGEVFAMWEASLRLRAYRGVGVRAEELHNPGRQRLKKSWKTKTPNPRKTAKESDKCKSKKVEIKMPL
jgi:hypothetical protein